MKFEFEYNLRCFEKLEKEISMDSQTPPWKWSAHFFWVLETPKFKDDERGRRKLLARRCWVSRVLLF